MNMYDRRLKTKLMKFKAFYSFNSVFLPNKKTVEFSQAEHILMWHYKTVTNKDKVYIHVQRVKGLISLTMRMIMIKCVLLINV